MKKFFIIAGEKSGDNLGAKLIAEIQNKLSNNCEIRFVGGEEIEKQLATTSLFPMSEINLMGFAEIIPHIPNLLNRINQTAEEIINFQPDYLITIDSPGFNYRLVKKLKESELLIKTKFVHYVAPSVWAYKEKRALKTAKLFDLLLSIIPWEPPYFEKHGLTTKFIGHPLFQDLHFINAEEKPLLKSKFTTDNNSKIIAVMAGSRFGEVKKLLPIIKNSLLEINSKIPIKPIFLTVPHIKNYLAENLPEGTIIIDETSEKQKILQISDVAIVKSGTVSLEVAALACPHIIIYKVSKITAWLVSKMIKIKFANLINISANKEIIPELIQENCSAKNISAHVTSFLEDNSKAKKQLIDCEIELKKFGFRNSSNPSNLAAEEILQVIS